VACEIGSRIFVAVGVLSLWPRARDGCQAFQMQLQLTKSVAPCSAFDGAWFFMSNMHNRDARGKNSPLSGNLLGICLWSGNAMIRF
jgi:hypothetical protein